MRAKTSKVRPVSDACVMKPNAISVLDTERM